MANPSGPKLDHRTYMRLAITEAEKSALKRSNFRVGALLVDASSGSEDGYTLELPGNMHAEQVCLIKHAQTHNVPEEHVGEVLPENAVLYTTMEPYAKRLSGNIPCVERILRTKAARRRGIRTVYLGVKEPETFVSKNRGRARLEEWGVKYVYMPGFEEEILEIATERHARKED